MFNNCFWSGSKLVIALACLIMASNTAAKEKVRSDDELKNLLINNAVMPKVPPVSRTSAVYLTLINQSNKPIVITDVEADIARHAMFHQTVEIDGVAKMRHIEQLVIEPNQSLELKPNGIHIMLMGLQDFSQSDSFQLTLHSLQSKKNIAVKIKPRE